MALKPAVGGDFLDLVELGKERALVAARIKRIDEPQPHKYDPAKETQPVVADLLVLSGKRKGHVQRGQTIMASGVTPTLVRGNKVGDDVLIRLETRNSFGKDWAAAQGPDDEALEKFGPLFEDDAEDPFAAAERAAGVEPAAPSNTKKSPWE